MSVLALVLASLFEGVGIVLLLPALSLFVKSDEVETGQEEWWIELARDFFNAIGLPMTLEYLLAGIIVVLIIKGVLSYLAMREVGKTAAIMAMTLRRRLSDVILNASWPYYLRLSVGRAANAYGLETELAMSSFLVASMILADLVIVAIYLMLALSISPIVSILAIVAGGALLVLFKKLIADTQDAGRKRARHLNHLVQHISNSLNAVKPIRAMNRQSYYAGLIEKDSVILSDAQKQQFFNKEALRHSREPALALFMGLGIFVALTYLDIALPVLMVMGFLFLRMVLKIGHIQSIYQNLMEYEGAFWSVVRFIEEGEKAREPKPASPVSAPAFSRAIVFNNVSFSYEPGEMVLESLSFEIKARGFYMLAGPSGSGKTTVIDLILGFYKPVQGAITIDDTDLAQLDIGSWREQIGYVPQDCVLLNATIAQNVTLGDQSYTEEDVRQALKASGALGFVEDMAQGLHEQLGERGNRLSGGQRQRIAIARALIKSPRLLILDEPSSALDAKTEDQILQTVKALSGEMTILMISHSERALGYADKVIRLGE